jgi:PEP-CTERM motif
MNSEDLQLEAKVVAAPEPSTWAMMLAGFAGFGYFANRALRRTGSAAV